VSIRLMALVLGCVPMCYVFRHSMNSLSRLYIDVSAPTTCNYIVLKNNIFACGRCRYVNKEAAQRIHTVTKNIAQRDTAKNEGH